MPRNKHWFAFVILPCLCMILMGCPKKDTDDTSEGAKRTGSETSLPETPAQGLQQAPSDPFDAKTPPAPTESELNALGPIREENRELLRFMPDNPSGFVVLHPARAIQASYFRDHADIAEMIVAQFYIGFNRYFPINGQIPFSNIKRVTFCTNPMKQKPELDPATGQPRPIPPVNWPASVCVLELNTPVDDLLLLSLFNIEGRVAVESLTPVTVNNMKAYDMVPPTEEFPVMERLVFADPTTIVFASGNVSEVTRVFDNEPAQGTIPARVLRTDMQNGDLIALYSTEGVPFGFTDMVAPYMMGRGVILQMQSQQSDMMQEEEGILAFVNAVKNMSIRIDLQVPDTGNLVQVDMDLQSSSDAETLKKAMETPISDSLTSLSLFVEKNRSATIPPEQVQAFEAGMKTYSFIISALEELKVASSENKLQLILKKAAGFDQNFAGILAPVYTQAGLEKQANLDREALGMISFGIGDYLQTHDSRFPHYAIFGENGTPLLSWRVALLPYLGEQDLYDQFHLNEPWDSEHNRTLVDKMPKVYADPSGQTPTGKTIFRMIGGEGSFLSQFPNGFTASDLKLPPGTLYMLAVTPEQAVEWTRPEYVQYQPEIFGQIVRTVFAAMFCSGDVRLLAGDNAVVAGQLPYWVSGNISPEAARELEAMQRWQQYQQMEIQQQNPQGVMPQPPNVPPMDIPPMNNPQMQMPPMGQP